MDLIAIGVMFILGLSTVWLIGACDRLAKERD